MTLKQKLLLTGLALVNLTLLAAVNGQPAEAFFGECGIDHECNCISGAGGEPFCGQSPGDCESDKDCLQ